MLDKDYLFISRRNQGDELTAKLLIDRYQQRIFALILYLIGDDRDKAYEIAASSFVEALCAVSFRGKGNSFLIKLVGAAVEKSRDVKIMSSFNETDFMDIPSEKREVLLIVKRALQALPFTDKALLLLRDQLRLSHEDICAILRISKDGVGVQTTQARVRLRKKIEEAL